MNDSHEMILSTTYPTGASEFLCPTCGRKLLVQWSPHSKLVVLVPGDTHATHSGGIGGLSMDFKTKQASDESLYPFEEWADKTDFDDL